MKIGILGGSFNPPHLGHVQLLNQVSRRLGFSKTIVIPNFKNPLKVLTDSPDAKTRAQMTYLAFENSGINFEISDIEIKKEKPSFIYETLGDLKSELAAEDQLYLILGSDLIPELEKWKNIKEILKTVNIVVVSRAGFDLPQKVSDLPIFLQDQITAFEFNIAELKSGHSIQFLNIEVPDVSSSVVRKKIRNKLSVEKLLPLSVESYIRTNKLYEKSSTETIDYKDLTLQIAKFLDSKKAIQIKGFDLESNEAVTQFAIVCSGTSTKHASSMAEQLSLYLKNDFGLLPYAVEGIKDGRWIVLDYGILMVHVFYDFVRSEYNLEGLWKDRKEISFANK